MSEDRTENLKRENLFTFKTDSEKLQKHLISIETKMNEFSTEFEDTLADFKKNIIDFNKRVTEVSKGLSTMTQEHEDLSNAANIAADAQTLLNK